MTTVAFDGKILAADTQLTKGEAASAHPFKKIFESRFTDYAGKEFPFYMAVAGDAGVPTLVLHWFVIDGWKMLPKYIEQTVHHEMEHDAVNSFYDMLQKFLSPEIDTDFTALFIIPKQGIFGLCSDQYGFIQEKAPFAMGSGGEIALGAMLAGKGAIDAVKIAGKVDVYTNRNVRHIKIEG